MAQYINKSDLVAEIRKRIDRDNEKSASYSDNSEQDYLCRVKEKVYQSLLSFIDTLEVTDPCALWIQYPSIEDGIKAFAEVYSFNIESQLFHQLTKEQQALWRKEIEQACISGGEVGVELATDPRYKKSLEAEEMEG